MSRYAIGFLAGVATAGMMLVVAIVGSAEWEYHHAEHVGQPAVDPGPIADAAPRSAQPTREP